MLPIVERRHLIDPARMGARALFDVIRDESTRALRAGAQETILTCDPALRGTHIARSLGRRCVGAGLGRLRTLTPADHANLTFLGATAAEPTGDTVAVLDCDEGSTEIAVGRPGSRPKWSASRPVGPKRLSERFIRSDPPAATEIALMRDAARRGLGTLRPPGCERVLIAAGAASSLTVLCGERVDRESVAQAWQFLEFGHSEIVAAQLGIEPRQVRRMIGSLVIAEAVSDLLGRPLRFGSGGYLEGIVFARSRRLSIGADVAGVAR